MSQPKQGSGAKKDLLNSSIKSQDDSISDIERKKLFENDDKSHSGSEEEAKDARSSGSESSEDDTVRKFEWDKKKIEALKNQNKVKIINGKIQDEVPEYRITVIEDDFI